VLPVEQGKRAFLQRRDTRGEIGKDGGTPYGFFQAACMFLELATRFIGKEFKA